MNEWMLAKDRRRSVEPHLYMYTALCFPMPGHSIQNACIRNVRIAERRKKLIIVIIKCWRLKSKNRHKKKRKMTVHSVIWCARTTADRIEPERREILSTKINSTLI